MIRAMNVRLIAAAVAILLMAGSAMAEEKAPPVFTFTEAQTKIIAEVAIAKRDAAAVEWARWNDLLTEIQKQATPAPKPDAKEPEKAP